MKNILLALIATTFNLIFVSCGNNDNNKIQEGKENNIEIASNSLTVDPDAKGGNKCLLEYQQKYDQLLSETDVLIATGFDKGKLTTEYLKFLKDPNYHEYEFSFENGRVGKILGTERVFEQNDYVKIRFIEEMSLNSFAYNYKAPTEAEIQETKDLVDDVIDGKIENENAKENVKKLEEKNVSKDQIKDTAGTLTDVFSEIAKGYEQIDNLGDAAVWNTKSAELHVLQNGVKFTLISNVSNDMGRNKEVALALAKIILNKCK